MNFSKFSLFFFVFVFIINISYGAECGGDIECACGDTITSSYIMKEDLQCDGNAFNLKSKIDCNGFTLSGTGGGFAFKFDNDNRIVTNCNIENFGYGVYITTRLSELLTRPGSSWREQLPASN